MSTAILVAGMHRSGTSATSGALRFFNVSLGNKLLKPGEDNPKGFWEHEEALKIHERLLTALGSRWDDVRALPAGWLNSEPAREALNAIHQLVLREFANKSLWAMKDPRICRLAPLWIKALGELNIQTVMLLVTRRPTEVAASIEKRNGWSQLLSELLWLRHVFDAELASRDLPRSVVTYDDLLSDPAICLSVAFSQLGIELPPLVDPVKNALEMFIEVADRHYQFADIRAPVRALSTISTRAYEVLVEIAHGKDDWSKLQALAESFQVEWDSYGGYIDAVAEMANRFSANETEALREASNTRIRANSLGNELATERERCMALQSALLTERDRIALMRRQLDENLLMLEEAGSRYRQDTSDLQRQRDVALAQRDAVEAQLASILRSRSWRWSAPLRVAARLMRRQFATQSFRPSLISTLPIRALVSLRSRGLLASWQRWKDRRRSLGATMPLQIPTPVDFEVRELQLPAPAAPLASIIIPVYNQLGHTLTCLRALAASGDTTSFEVIVVDDASIDDTPRVLAGIPGLRMIRNDHNLGFIGACNAGAAKARGQFVAFLNNDTAVQSCWLDALLRTFAEHSDTGLAGSKLVYPDGRLQEAGGIVFSDGSGWNYGRFADSAHPSYNYVREVDYCSGAAIALPRALFEMLGGFDSNFAPAYYEDTDLAMRVRQHGMKVRYQPASVVVHFEGATSGIDLNSGVKAHQVTNQVKFLARWRDVLDITHPTPGTDPQWACEHRARHRVLVLDACTPTPDRDSGSVRMLALMRLLIEEGCTVTFFSENRAHDGVYTQAMQAMGVEVWWQPWLGDLRCWLIKHGPRFNRIIGSRHYVLSPLLPLLREYAPQAQIVFDTVDLHYLREQREAELANDLAKRRIAEQTRKAELDLVRYSDLTWVVSAVEQKIISSEIPDARVQILSNIHVVRGPGPDFAVRNDLLFIGGYRHPPNIDAVHWLADKILPLLHASRPDIRLHLVGGDAPDSVVALGRKKGIVFHGYVPNLIPLLDSTRLALAPLRYGAGVKGKINQSLAHGQPVIATACAIEGMHLTDGVDVLVADKAEDFVAAVLRAYDDPVLWHRLSEGGLANTHAHFSFESARRVIRAWLDQQESPSAQHAG